MVWDGTPVLRHGDCSFAERHITTAESVYFDGMSDPWHSG